MDTEVFRTSGKKGKMAVDNSKHGSAFVPIFEKPRTRLKTGTIAARNVVADMRNEFDQVLNLEKAATKGKKNSTEVGKSSGKSNMKTELRNQVGIKVKQNVVEDKLNNNASIAGNASDLTNPDPSKYVLTNWGNVSVLGKRKIVQETEVDPEDDVFNNSALDDGIDVIVDTDEFAKEETVKNLSSSDEETAVQLGGTAEDEVVPGTSKDLGLDKSEEKLLKDHPYVHNIVNKLLDARLKHLLPGDKSIGKGSKGKQAKIQSEVKLNKIENSTKAEKTVAVNNVIKSPSDTMIYAPALQKMAGGKTDRNVVFNPNEIDISTFVEAIREETAPRGRTANEGICDEQGVDVNLARKVIKRAGTSANEEARKRVQSNIIEAEKFKAKINTPGNDNPFILPENYMNEHEIVVNEVLDGTANQQPVFGNLGNDANLQLSAMIPNIGSGVSDDDFFHLTCHIEPSLIHKIEKGEFIELEKLLPKDRNSFTRGGGEENRLEWVQHDGNTFLVSAVNKDQKITRIRKWEQAFRAYTTIYCAANPHRSKEMWQYISVINTAASPYTWDNVYNYDITFRHLMAFNPNRSWAVTYNQMWNLSMRDPLPRNNFGHRTGGFQFHNNSNGGGKGHNNSNNNNQGKRKPDYCWNFNKGIKCKFAPKCKFIERCKYCDSPSHGVNACEKLEQKKANSNQNTSSSDSSAK